MQILHSYGICDDCGAALFYDIEHTTMTCPRCGKQYFCLGSEEASKLLIDPEWAPRSQQLCRSLEACENIERENTRLGELAKQDREKMAAYIHEEWPQVEQATDEAEQLSAAAGDHDPVLLHYAESWNTLKNRMERAIQKFGLRYEMPLL